MPIPIDSTRLQNELKTLATFTGVEPAAEGTAVTRIVFSPDDLRARNWLKDLAAAEGFHIREDAVGNTFIRWHGTEPGLPAVATGSHTDAIPHAGMYDGTVGVLGGLEAMRALKRSGLQPRRSIELVMLTSEEPTRFGIGCLGSRLISGTLDPNRADTLKDKDDAALAIVRTAAGFTGSLASRTTAGGSLPRLARTPHRARPPARTRRHTDRHRHQHRRPRGYRFTITGLGGHAGALLMPDRRDALCAAAELILSIERHALATGAIDTVATVGTCDVYPGAVNSVPSRVLLQLDIRDIDPARRESVMQAVRRDMRRASSAPQRHHRRGARQRRRPRAILPPHRAAPRADLHRTRHRLQEDGQPRLSRFALHGPHRPHRHDLHPLPRRRQPPPRRVRRTCRYRSRHPRPRLSPC